VGSARCSSRGINRSHFRKLKGCSTVVFARRKRGSRESHLNVAKFVGTEILIWVRVLRASVERSVLQLFAQNLSPAASFVFQLRLVTRRAARLFWKRTVGMHFLYFYLALRTASSPSAISLSVSRRALLHASAVAAGAFLFVNHSTVHVCTTTAIGSALFAQGT
jgi:hypothetical protein